MLYGLNLCKNNHQSYYAYLKLQRKTHPEILLKSHSSNLTPQISLLKSHFKLFCEFNMIYLLFIINVLTF